MQNRALMERKRIKKFVSTMEPSSSGMEEKCSENVKQYLSDSTLHGLRYVGDSSLSIFERLVTKNICIADRRITSIINNLVFYRLFFGFAFVAVLLASAYFITNVYQKWSATPVIISMNPVASSISELPFPAVTICNMNQAKHSVVKNFKPDSTETIFLKSLCHDTSGNFTKNKMEKINWPTFRKFILKVIKSYWNLIAYS